MLPPLNIYLVDHSLYQKMMISPPESRRGPRTALALALMLIAFLAFGLAFSVLSSNTRAQSLFFWSFDGAENIVVNASGSFGTTRGPMVDGSNIVRHFVNLTVEDSNKTTTMTTTKTIGNDAAEESKTTSAPVGSKGEADRRSQPPQQKGDNNIKEANDANTKKTKIKTGPKAPCGADQRIVQLFFPHVNKAGGRTLEATFASKSAFQYGPMRGNVRSNTKTFVLIDGHRDFDVLEAERSGMEDNSRTCSRWIFLARDPLERTLSAFQTTTGRSITEISKQGDQNHFPCTSRKVRELLTNPNFTFNEFALLPKQERDTCDRDFHVRYLGGEKRSLELAKERVLKMDAIGLVESFPVSMQLLNWELGLDMLLYTPVFNKNEGDKTLSEEAKKVLREMNMLDVQLYEFIKEKVYKPRVEAMRAFYNGSFPWGDSPAAVCDKKVICWDRRNPASPTWDIHDEIPEKLRGDFSTLGLQKQYTICGPAGGCKLIRSSGGERGGNRARRRLHDRPSIWDWDGEAIPTSLYD